MSPGYGSAGHCEKKTLVNVKDNVLRSLLYEMKWLYGKGSLCMAEVLLDLLDAFDYDSLS